MTQDERKVIEMALEALETAESCIDGYHGDAYLLIDTSITAMKELLAQPEQEPVAFIDEQGTLRYYKPSDFNQCEYGGLVRLCKEKT